MKVIFLFTQEDLYPLQILYEALGGRIIVQIHCSSIARTQKLLYSHTLTALTLYVEENVTVITLM